MTTDEKKIDKFIKTLLNLPVSQERLSSIEDYLRGKTGLRSISQYPPIDLSGVEYWRYKEMILEECKDLTSKSYVVQLFEIYYSLGRADIYNWLPVEFLKKIHQNPGIDKRRYIAILASRLASRQSLEAEEDFQEIRMCAGEDPVVLKAAMEFLKKDRVYSRLILTSFYFLLKYESQYSDYLGKNMKKESLFSRFTKIFEKKQETILQSEDFSLLNWMETVCLNTLLSFFTSSEKTFSFQDLRREFIYDELSDETVRTLKECTLQQTSMVKNIAMLAFLTYPLSRTLKNIVRSLSVIDTELVLGAAAIGADFTAAGAQKIREYMLEYDRIFYMEPKALVKWASEESYEEYVTILEKHLKQNPDAYIAVLKKSSGRQRERLAAVMKREAPDRWKSFEVEQKAKVNREKTELIEKIADLFEMPYNTLVVRYLNGEIPISDLYDGVNDSSRLNWWYRLPNDVDRYLDYYGSEEFTRKMHTLHVMLYPESCKHTLDIYSAAYDTKDGETFWSELKKEGLRWRDQIRFAAKMYEDFQHAFYHPERRESWLSLALEQIHSLWEEDRKKLLEECQACDLTGRAFMLQLYPLFQEDCREEILSFAQDTAKNIKEELLRVISAHPEWEEEILTLLNSKKSAERELAVRVLAAWIKEEKNYDEILRAAMEKEKSSKVLTLFHEILNIDEKEEDTDPAKTLEELVAEAYSGGKKRRIEWLDGHRDWFPSVHRKDGSEASVEYLEALCLYYVSMKKYGINQNAKRLAEDLNKEELEKFVNSVYTVWKLLRADTNKKWVLYFVAFHGGTHGLETLKRAINEWTKNSRIVLAAEAVRALALSPEPQAILMVDDMSRNSKYRKIKEAAENTLESLAADLGLTREELEDRIVPTLGFDEKMERYFDYGERSFTVTITPTLEIEIKDSTGKKLKSMPAPGKKDDEEKATAAYEAFKEMKKQMKVITVNQKNRLNQAFVCMRFWTIDGWKKLFVENPIMHQFAIGLIWGIYEEEKLTYTFRYMEDGSYNTEEEEEFDLPVEGRVGLVHPLELTPESIAAWREQLSDYEIIQPINQLDRPVYTVTEEEKAFKELDRFGGMLVNDGTLIGKMRDNGWFKGNPQDGGFYLNYYREDTALGIGINLSFSGASIAGAMDKKIMIYTARFYRIAETERRILYEDRLDDQNTILLSEVPARYFSEIVLQLTKVTASSTEKNENWRSRQQKKR